MRDKGLKHCEPLSVSVLTNGPCHNKTSLFLNKAKTTGYCLVEQDTKQSVPLFLLPWLHPGNFMKPSIM